MVSGIFGGTDGQTLRPTEWLVYVVDPIHCVVVYIMKVMQVGVFNALKDHMLSGLKKGQAGIVDNFVTRLTGILVQEERDDSGVDTGLNYGVVSFELVELYM